MKKIICLFICLFAGSANATIILDTTSLTVGGSLGFGNTSGNVPTHQNPLGQSFILAEDTNNIQIGAVIGWVEGNAGSSNVQDFTFSLVAGAGVNGSSLGFINFTETFGGNGESHLVMQDFSSLGTLSAGTYTAVFSGAGNYVSDIDFSSHTGDSSSNPYNIDGLLTLPNDQTQDFLVRVTGDVNVIPEPPVVVPVPAPVWLFGSGLLGLFGANKKRKRINL